MIGVKAKSVRGPTNQTRKTLTSTSLLLTQLLDQNSHILHTAELTVNQNVNRHTRPVGRESLANPAALDWFVDLAGKL